MQRPRRAGTRAGLEHLDRPGRRRRLELDHRQRHRRHPNRNAYLPGHRNVLVRPRGDLPLRHPARAIAVRGEDLRLRERHIPIRSSRTVGVIPLRIHLQTRIRGHIHLNQTIRTNRHDRRVRRRRPVHELHQRHHRRTRDTARRGIDGPVRRWSGDRERHLHRRDTARGDPADTVDLDLIPVRRRHIPTIRRPTRAISRTEDLRHIRHKQTALTRGRTGHRTIRPRPENAQETRARRRERNEQTRDQSHRRRQHRPPRTTQQAAEERTRTTDRLQARKTQHRALPTIARRDRNTEAPQRLTAAELSKTYGQDKCEASKTPRFGGGTGSVTGAENRDS